MACALGTAAGDWTLDPTGRGPRPSPPSSPGHSGRSSVTSSAPTRPTAVRGLGTVGTGLLLLASLPGVVSYLTITTKDRNRTRPVTRIALQFD
jgi:hypothetical protein